MKKLLFGMCVLASIVFVTSCRMGGSSTPLTREETSVRQGDEGLDLQVDSSIEGYSLVFKNLDFK